MEFINFEIQNFKGIAKVLINLERAPKSNIYTIVGLNESGKSSVLEAISRMGRYPLDLAEQDPSKSKLTDRDYQSFIPAEKRANFTGEIHLIANLKLTPDEKTSIQKFIKKEFNWETVQLKDTIRIDRTMFYKDSSLDKRTNYWDLVPKVKKTPRSKNNFNLSHQDYPDEWKRLTEFILPTIPQILYFKNEIFDIPDKIYIHKEPQKDGRPALGINEFYRDVIQDVLFALDNSLDLDKHIIERKISDDEIKLEQLDSLLQKMSSHITRTVMTQWETIFHRKMKGKKIKVLCEFDANRDVYIKLKLEDGNERFNINERSTGFRWFFAFIILTQYRGHRNEAAIFLYDEPASNLHSSAQKQLLECFRQLPPQFKIIYSTHSHHLINPEWLDSTYVVRNIAEEIDDSDVEALGLDTSDICTNIDLVPYRKFVAKNPNKLSYFQPILDVLQYKPSDIENTKNCVLVEGKSDYYALRYLTKVCLKLDLAFDFIPCMGSGTCDQLIALYAGWGKKFVVLLDSDKAGKSEKSRYLEKFGSLLNGKVICYGDINSSLDKKGLEKIVGNADCTTIHQATFPQEKFSKKMFLLSIQELLSQDKPVTLTLETQTILSDIISDLSNRLQQA